MIRKSEILVGARDGVAAELSGVGDALLQIEYPGQVLVELGLVLGAQARREVFGVLVDVVQQACPVLARTRLSCAALVRVESVENLVEHDLGIDGLREGLGVARPGDVSSVSAAITTVASTHSRTTIDAEL